MANTVKSLEFSVNTVEHSGGPGPATVTISAPTRQDITTVSVWEPDGSVWHPGNRLRASFFQKNYQGALSWNLSKPEFSPVHVLESASGGPTGPVSAPAPNSGHQAPRQAVSSTGGAPRGGLTPLTPKDHQICVQVVLKAVIATGGTESDCDKWITYALRKFKEFEG